MKLSIWPVAGVLSCLGLIVVAILMGGPLMGFIDLGVILLVPFGTFFLLAATHGFATTARSLAKGLGQLMAGDVSHLEPDERAQVAAVAESGSIFTVLTGAIGVLMGAMSMLRELDDLTKIGPAMAVVLLSLLYAFCQALFVFVPIVRSSRMASDEGQGGA